MRCRKRIFWLIFFLTTEPRDKGNNNGLQIDNEIKPFLCMILGRCVFLLKLT